jgi:heme-degrading monooxygenase HmoA
MIIQIVKFETKLSFEEVLDIARERAPEFRKFSGLLQKYYVRTDRPNRYGGVYIWESPEAMKEYRESDLASSIPQAYQVLGPPEIEIYEVAFSLRD